MYSKQWMYTNIKNFVYSNNLKDLNVFSKQYFNSVIVPYFSNKSKDSNYSLIYIDFNKFNDINNTYGYEIGNIILQRSLKLIKTILPQNSICARLGGDEFAFIIDNCPQTSNENFSQKINSILKVHEQEIFFSTVTSYSIHSSSKNSIYDMIEEADLKITELKNNCLDDSSSSKWITLEKKLTQNLTSFFKSLRFYKKEIDVKFLKKLYMHSISSVGNILENNFTLNSEQIENRYFENNLDSSEIEKLFLLFQNPTPSLLEINSISDTSYDVILNDLIHDPVTGNFSKNYFEEYLLNFCNKTYKIKYISTSFVKLYNSLFSHNATDIKDTMLVNRLLEYLKNEQHIEFSNNLFLTNGKNYFVSLGAGDYIIALSPDQDIDNEKLNKYIEDNIPTNPDLEDLLYLTCNDNFYYINKYNYEDVLVNSTHECKEKKDNYKMCIMEDDVIVDVLSNIIYHSVEYYSENISQSDTIEQKTKFLHLVSQVMLQSSQKINKTEGLTK